MKLSQVTKHGRQVWQVHYRDPACGNSKPYATRVFATRPRAAAWMEDRERERSSLGSAWMALPASARAELIEAHTMAAESGVSVTDAVRRLRGSGKAASTLGDLVKEVIEAKRQKGLRPRSLSALGGTLEGFARSNDRLPIDRVTPQMVVNFLASRDWGARRKRGVLTDLGTMFNHAVRRGYILRSPCAAVESPIVEATATPILTPDQAERLFRACEQREPELLGFLALAAFGGFRTESEVARMTRAQVVDSLAHDLIAPPVVNKTRMRRVVPILPCLRAWLEVWIPLGVEPVPINFSRRWMRVKEEAWLVPWPQNVLRHSRVSYRLAQTGDEVLTAAEDGHSAQMLHQHYRALVTAADAERYFGIFPTPGLDLQALARAERERQDAARQAGLRRPNRVENFPSDSTG